MSLTSRDMWGVLRGSCREPLCDCQRYVVVCPSDESAAKIRCEFCNHCPSIHGRITDLGDTEQGLTVPPILPIVGTGINGPSEVQQPYHPDCSKDHEREVAEVLQESAQPGCSKDGSLWVEAPPPSDLPVDMSQQLAINEAPAPSKPALKVHKNVKTCTFTKVTMIRVYRCQLLCKTIENAWSVFKNNKLGHEVFAVIKAMSDRVFKKMSKFSDPEEFMDNFLKEMCRESPPKKFQEYFDVKPKYDDTQISPDDVPTQGDMNEIMRNAESKLECISKHGTSSKSSLYCCVVIYIVSLRFLLKRHPGLHNAVMDTALKPSAHDDDGGPISFVCSQLTWDELMWTMLIELFGSSEQARMVLEFLALGLSTDYSGQQLMFMHGEAANGKSLFLGILRHLFGKDSKLVRTLHSNFFTYNSEERMAAPLRNNSEEIRFVIQRKIPILDMDKSGRRLLKQITGGDTVSIPQQYDRYHNDFRLSAKFLMSSNDIPYLSPSMEAEQKRFMIVPTLSTFLADKSCLRKQLLKHLSADRYCRRLFSTPYPDSERDYIKETNKQANTIFTQSGPILGARNMLFREHYLNILEDSFATELCSAPRSIPTQRWLLGNPNLMFDEAQEKLGAALCRILLDHIVPSMGGLENVDRTVGKLQSYVSENANTFSSYKDVLYVILKRLIVNRRGFSIKIDTLMPMVAEELTEAKRTLKPILFGRDEDAGSEAFKCVEGACKTEAAFCRTLKDCHFNLSSMEDGMHLNDFQSMEEFLLNRKNLDVSPIEALVMRDDLKTYKPDNMFYGPTNDEVKTIRDKYLKPPIVRSDFKHGTDAGNSVKERRRNRHLMTRIANILRIPC